MPTNFIFNNGGNNADFSDVFIPVSAFAQGGLWIWGNNTNSELGDGTFTGKKSSPVQTISGGINWKQVDCGSFASAAIKTDGALWLWGSRDFGNMGNNVSTAGFQFSPVQTISGGTNWKQVACGYYSTAAIKTDGTLWTWGYNAIGQLGNNSTTNASSPVQTVAGGTNWKQVSVGNVHDGAIKTDGTLWLWGRGDTGGLGDNTIVNKSSPVQTISGGTNWKQVSCGDTDFTGAIKTDGTLWLWGNNSFGQLGDNTSIDKASPIQTVSGGTNWKQVSCGYDTTAAIKTDGTLWLWGKNTAGQLGNNSTTNVLSPIQTVSAGTNWLQVSSGGDSSTAIKTNGTLWTWGRNLEGQLGDNTIDYRSSPVQTVASGTNWKQVSSNIFGMSAIQNNF